LPSVAEKLDRHPRDQYPSLGAREFLKNLGGIRGYKL
jgi:hypothetical protein